MAIAAQRFKFLDKETNIPTIDFSKLTDNQVYNDVTKAVESALAEFQEGGDMLDKLKDSLSSLKDMVMNAASDLMNTLKGVLNSVIAAIEKLELPQIIKDIFKSVKETSLEGTKQFLGELMHVGSSFLCNNLDFLKLFMLGYSLKKNVLAGLLIALLLSWLDRYCKGFSAKEIKKSSNLKKIEKMFPQQGTKVDTNSAFSTYTNMYSSFLKAKEPVSITVPLTPAAFISQVTGGNVKTSIANLRSSEVTNANKKVYTAAITTELGNHTQGSPEYMHLLQAKGDLYNMPTISEARRDKGARYSNLSEQFGTMVKNLSDVDLTKIPTYAMTEVEKGLQTKLVTLKDNAAASPDLKTRGNNVGDFKTFNFDSILPVGTVEEKTYLATLKGNESSHRPHDISPVTGVFLGVA